MITAPSVEENTKDPSAPEQEVVPEEDMLSLPEEKLTLTAAPSSYHSYGVLTYRGVCTI